MDDSRIKDVSSLLSSFFSADKLRQGERYADFFASWQSFVGSRLAAHSRVADIDKGLLVIEAEHPGWIQLLQLRQTRILEDVARRYPELGLRGIAFKLSGQGREAPRAAARVEATEEEPEPMINPPEEKAQATALEEIGDPAFRALLKSLKDAIQGKSP
jgi:hypothetical protein